MTFRNELGVLNVLNVLNMPNDASLACWVAWIEKSLQFVELVPSDFHIIYYKSELE